MASFPIATNPHEHQLTPEQGRANIGRDYVLGSWTDDLGALHLQLYDLRKAGT